MMINQNYIAPLEAFEKIVGVGYVRGPFGPYGNQKNPYYRWTANGPEALAAIDMIGPYLFDKGVQAQAAKDKYISYLESK